MDQCALLAGIDEYQDKTFLPTLGGPEQDAQRMEEVLARHEDGKKNYDCHVQLGPVSRVALRRHLRELFTRADGGHALFYFAGHGAPSDVGGYLCSFDGVRGDPGIPMSELVTVANNSRAQQVILILDCCYAGSAGDSPYSTPMVELRKGVTILAGTRPSELAKEVLGQGVFTTLVVEALQGGAADIRGNVDAASVYAHAAESLGPWDQKPLFKCYADRPPQIRCCAARVPDEVLRRLTTHFLSVDAAHQLDPSYEFSHASANPVNVARFNDFKKLRDSGLITANGKDLYFVAVESGRVALTTLGKRYWRAVRANRI